MKNYPIRIYDNIGAKFSVDNNTFIIGSCLSGFSTLDTKHTDTYIPYLAKNKNLWETGIGFVKNDNSRIIVERIKVISSSNNNYPVSFENNEDNKFYIFANQDNFNTAFNNISVVDNDQTIQNIKAVYLVDITNNNIRLSLPDAKSNPGLALEFKTNSGTNYCQLLYNKNSFLYIFQNSYVKLVSDGKEWIEILNLQNDISSESKSFSATASNFAALNTPVGASGSLQYNDNGDFASAPAYISSDNKILLGSSSESSAFSILPTSGNYNTVFNNNNYGSDFIVKGSGDKNLFFGYDGKLGINIPGGSRPQTVFHILNNSCQEGIRLENRNQCYPANITLYHKPNNIIQPNSPIASINLAAKNSSNNQVEYVQLVARANSYTSNATKGELAIRLENSGSKIEPVKINTSGIFFSSPLYVSSIKYSSSTTSGNILMSDSSGNVILTNVNNTPIINLLDGGVVQFTGVCS